MEVVYWAQNVRDDGEVLGGVEEVLELCSCDVDQTCVVQHGQQQLLPLLQLQDYDAAGLQWVVEEWHDVGGHVVGPHGAQQLHQEATAANCIPECVAYYTTELGHCMGEWTMSAGWYTQASEPSYTQSLDVYLCTQE